MIDWLRNWFVDRLIYCDCSSPSRRHKRFRCEFETCRRPWSRSTPDWTSSCCIAWSVSRGCWTVVLERQLVSASSLSLRRRQWRWPSLNRLDWRPRCLPRLCRRPRQLYSPPRRRSAEWLLHSMFTLRNQGSPPITSTYTQWTIKTWHFIFD